MPNRHRIALALAAAAAMAFTLPVVARAASDGFEYIGGEGGWQLAPRPYGAPANGRGDAANAAAAPAARPLMGFEYVGGEAGWELVQHHYALANGRFEHTAECDHSVRTAAAAPTALEVEQVKEFSGA